ncbi:hypothetical protein [Larkinella rosea]|uniref:Uncharacterized protein n=1 Tax=Larkinella rosea TaxID=2025312 RepID=A0A3P1C3I8_9BACT|nr:hypothetical protein [Larkinella rosea]RRB07384.1 hypothetical protein EHT25_06285 [Larkinella rosea]
MNDISDDDLQEWLDASNRSNRKPGKSEPEDEAVRLYQQLYDELSVEPVVGLSYGFSVSVVRQIQVKETCRRERQAYIWVGLCLFLMLIVVLSIQAVYRVNGLIETLRALDDIKFPVLFISALLSLIQWADRRFVKRKLSSKLP